MKKQPEAPPILSFVVDDEPLARSRLKQLVEGHSRLQWAGEARNGEDAIELINTLQPDLVFLDIRMPGISGLEVIEHLVHRPHIVFTTAYEQFAVTAFELQALDYLLKPFGKRRFDKAVERLTPGSSKLATRLEAALGKSSLSQLFVRERGRLKAVATDSIMRIAAADDYAELICTSSTHLMSIRMKDLENRLDPTKFVRIHRSWIINVGWIDEVEPCGNGRHEIRMKDGVVLESSRTGAGKLRSILEAKRPATD